ncbi:hypothetical protein COMNV_01173 [Commensalibacter sp. Nvir]|uniref:hypothetical protein n=1 Tax=Commensalibacter sp. Nvir TaxID=3069817 RepID=UPI002D35C551|nr:hypothetical protein COMNV_01173 [Commensalibacter sp. Nvir]
MEIAKILITVKTYPCRSGKYIETVCTAGFKEDGSWIRLYPVPFRFSDNRYKKYQWIEVKIAKNTKDKRPESYRVIDIDNIKLLGTMGTENNWRDRRQFILNKNKIYTKLNDIIKRAHNNELSLAIFKPTKITDFIVENVKIYKENKNCRLLLEQMDLFSNNNQETLKLMPRLSKKFFYKFEDDEGKESRLMVEDWEIGQLYLNCIKREPTDEDAVEKVKMKYWDTFVFEKDLFFFLGTTSQFHNKKSANPFVITGIFYPPIPSQNCLL